MKPRYRVRQDGAACECYKIKPSNYSKDLLEACKMPAHSFSENEIRLMLCAIAFGLGSCFGAIFGVIL